MYRILLVCTGNICRSPTAEGVLRHRLEQAGLSDRVTVDSAGTHGYHIGEAPDVRSIRAAEQRKIRLHDLRARQVCKDDFHEFDLILGLDDGHVRALKRMAPKDAKSTVALFLEYAAYPHATEVPDPYYGEAAGFEYVLDLVESGSDGLIAKLRTMLG